MTRSKCDYNRGSYCDGNENCKWVVAAKLIGNSTGEDRNNIQLVYQTETKIRDLLTMDDRTFACLGERGRPRTDVDETTTIDECITKPAPTTPPTPEIARSKALSERPNRVVFAPGNATDCGASNCMPAADDVDEYTWGMSTAYAGYIRSDGTITHSVPFPLNQSGWAGFPPPPNDPSGRLSIGSDYYSCWFAGSPTLAGTGSNACMLGTKQRYSAGACWGNPAVGLSGYGPFVTERRNQSTAHRTTPISISRPAFGIEFSWPT